jgi:hypothetical protein
MILAARRAEFDYYQKAENLEAKRFIPTPDAVISVMLKAALKLVEPAPSAPKRSRKTM